LESGRALMNGKLSRVLLYDLPHNKLVIIRQFRHVEAQPAHEQMA